MKESVEMEHKKDEAVRRELMEKLMKEESFNAVSFFKPITNVLQNFEGTFFLFFFFF